MTAEQAEETTPVRLVYTGKHDRYTGGKALHRYLHAGDLSHWGGRAKPLVTGAPVGAVIEVQTLADGRYYTAGDKAPQLVDQLDDQAQVLAWEVEHRGVVARERKEAAQKRLAREMRSPFAEQLEPVRRAIEALPWDARAGAIAAVIAAITSGRPL